MRQKRPSTLAAHLLLIAVTLVWGTTFPLVKAALADAPPLLFNVLRMGLATLVLVAVNWPSLRGLSRRDLRLPALAGVFLALGYSFQTAGLARTSPSRSAFLTGLVVVLVPLFSAVPRLGPPDAARPGARVYGGALLAFAGLVLLTTEPGSGLAVFSGMHLGEWLTLLCAIAFAAHLLAVGRAAATSSGPAMPARRLGTLQIAFATLVMAALLPLGGPLHFHSSRTLWAALFVTAVLATAAAFTIQSWAQQRLPPSHLALIFTLEPVFAWLTSLLFLRERLGARALAGAASILAGILLAELGPTSRRAPGIQAPDSRLAGV